MFWLMGTVLNSDQPLCCCCSGLCLNIVRPMQRLVHSWTGVDDDVDQFSFLFSSNISLLANYNDEPILLKCVLLEISIRLKLFIWISIFKCQPHCFQLCVNFQSDDFIGLVLYIWFVWLKRSHMHLGRNAATCWLWVKNVGLRFFNKKKKLC